MKMNPNGKFVVKIIPNRRFPMVLIYELVDDKLINIRRPSDIQKRSMSTPKYYTKDEALCKMIESFIKYDVLNKLKESGWDEILVNNLPDEYKEKYFDYNSPSREVKVDIDPVNDKFYTQKDNITKDEFMKNKWVGYRIFKVSPKDDDPNMFTGTNIFDDTDKMDIKNTVHTDDIRMTLKNLYHAYKARYGMSADRLGTHDIYNKYVLNKSVNHSAISFSEYMKHFGMADDVAGTVSGVGVVSINPDENIPGTKKNKEFKNKLDTIAKMACNGTIDSSEVPILGSNNMDLLTDNIVRRARLNFSNHSDITDKDAGSTDDFMYLGPGYEQINKLRDKWKNEKDLAKRSSYISQMKNIAAKNGIKTFGDLSDAETKWTPPEGLFTRSAKEIADTIIKASESHGQAVKRINFYINRSGENLNNKSEVLKAKEIIEGSKDFSNLNNPDDIVSFSSMMIHNNYN